MSPQFVDFNGDGNLDIVAGIFDGSPHVALGDGKAWSQPKSILDKNGARIVLNAFWNFDSKKWDKTNRCDPIGGRPMKDGKPAESHLTSAIAMDWDRDGDFDLVLGDHRSGYVYLRRNAGSNQKPQFEARNELVMAGDQPMHDPGTVATLRAVDWNRDGLLDLMVSGMGDPYGTKTGGGVAVYLNTGPTNDKKATFGQAIWLIVPSKKGAMHKPSRPDSGLHPEAVDFDGDGDLDLLVGGYSMWTPAAKDLTAEQKTEVKKLKADLAEVDAAQKKIMDAIYKATEGLGQDERAAKLKKQFEGVSSEINKLNKTRRELSQRIQKLEPRAQRVSFTWLYENLAKTASGDTTGQR
jgi:hypothetical protein